METTEIIIESRPTQGTSNCGRIRVSGLIPAVIYSKGLSTKNVQVNKNDFLKIATKSRTSQVFKFKSEISEISGKTGVIKDLQLQPTSGNVLHIDFQVLETGRKVKVKIPVLTSGDPYGVKNEGGVLTIVSREVTCVCPSETIPTSLHVELTELKLGQKIKASDIKLPSGVRLASNPNATVAEVVASRLAKLLEEDEKAAAEKAAAAATAATPAGAAGSTATAGTATPAVAGADKAADKKPAADKGKK